MYVRVKLPCLVKDSCPLRDHRKWPRTEPGGRVASTWRNSHDPESHQTAVFLAFDSHDPGKVTACVVVGQGLSGSEKLLPLKRLAPCRLADASFGTPVA